ncbi:hypothetical protein [Acuticoccus sp. I52.16.1]|uniref:hypothetical protein n=1 Tax=Acuticoccus sp. I52.16.1 TaxID=2928472 RepID=UPI001FD3B6C3|nr:hypothetical protein [Acuticoccus sp. I52.16.1]UOM34868.1 hypothetical protein MRB58_01255 [Acuticoccus sp. I52.16.1]
MSAAERFTDPVVITVARLSNKPGTWVVIDDCSLVYAEFASHREALAGAHAAAAQLRRDDFPIVTVEDLWEGHSGG